MCGHSVVGRTLRPRPGNRDCSAAVPPNKRMQLTRSAMTTTAAALAADPRVRRTRGVRNECSVRDLVPHTR
jgi:hypothetical protein